MDSKKDMKILSNIKKILIINLGGIGDLLLSTPALRALKETYPGAKISLMAVPRAYEVVKGLPYVDEVVKFHAHPLRFLEDIGALLYLRNRHFDIAVNMRTLVSAAGARKIKLLMDIIAPGIRAGRDTEGMGKFFNISVPETWVGEKPEMEYDIDMALALGAHAADRRIDLDIDEASRRKSEEILKRAGVGPDDILVGMHPGGILSRRWPIENFARAIELIYRNAPRRFVITGSKSEAPLAVALKKSVDIKIIDLCGKLNVKETAALMMRCRVFISNDTGPMHIAAALNVPLVAIFGPGDITRYDPRKISDRVTVLYKKAPCAPCVRHRCNDMKCLKSVSPEEVAEAALKWIR
jgi:heptosyltransferase-2